MKIYVQDVDWVFRVPVGDRQKTGNLKQAISMAMQSAAGWCNDGEKPRLHRTADGFLARGESDFGTAIYPGDDEARAARSRRHASTRPSPEICPGRPHGRASHLLTMKPSRWSGGNPAGPFFRAVCRFFELNFPDRSRYRCRPNGTRRDDVPCARQLQPVTLPPQQPAQTGDQDAIMCLEGITQQRRHGDDV